MKKFKMTEDPYFINGVEKFWNDDAENALKDFNKAIDLNPSNASAYAYSSYNLILIHVFLSSQFSILNCQFSVLNSI